MLTDEQRDEAIKNALLRQEVTNMAIHLLVNLLEKKNLLGKDDFTDQVQKLAFRIEKLNQPGVKEQANWLREIFGGRRSSGEVIDFPKGDT